MTAIQLPIRVRLRESLDILNSLAERMPQGASSATEIADLHTLVGTLVDALLNYQGLDEFNGIVDSLMTLQEATGRRRDAWQAQMFQQITDMALQTCPACRTAKTEVTELPGQRLTAAKCLDCAVEWSVGA